MARLIFTNALDKQATRYPWLRSLLFAFEAGVMHVFWYAFRALTPEQSARVGRVIVGTLGPRSAKARMVRENLTIAFPSLDRSAVAALARQTWRSIGLVFGEYPQLDRIARLRLEVVDRCNLETYRRRERQAIFIGAHFSNWEIMALAIARAGVPLLALHAPLQNQQLGKLMDRARAQLGCTMLGRGESMRALIKQVRDGGSIGMLLDLSMNDGVPVPFFGHPMRTTLTPARMAQRYGCDIVPVRTERLGEARFRVHLYPPLTIDRTPRDADGEQAQALAIARQLNALMEKWISARPDEWMAANRRWEKALHREMRRTNPV
jgi:KDO2-lipid IV(A) lauroyltransferase